ncbi:MAG: hypothetical protein HGA45_17850 [Chloroflexales bacterium]|nr:hypothetical protein [Chloroflexales bacterium]
MLYAYFGGLGADKRATYELVLELHESAYVLTSVLAARGRRDNSHPAPTRWGWLRQPFGAASTRRLYAGTEVRRALLILLQAACAANLAELGQRYCYVLPSVPSQAGALAVLLPSQLRYDSSLPIHPQIWQTGRPLDTLPIERHSHVCADAHAMGMGMGPGGEGRAARGSTLSRPGR